MVVANTAARVAFLTALFVFSATCAPASAQSEALRAALPGASVKPGDAPGTWIVGEWRQSQVALAPFGFRISLTWNGLDDDEWPFERIVAALASPLCGQIAPGLVQRRVEALYRTRSLTPAKDLGGNAGSTFKKRLTTDLGQCRAEFLAEGARWHSLSAVVFVP